MHKKINLGHENVTVNVWWTFDSNSQVCLMWTINWTDIPKTVSQYSYDCQTCLQVNNMYIHLCSQQYTIDFIINVIYSWWKHKKISGSFNLYTWILTTFYTIQNLETLKHVRSNCWLNSKAKVWITVPVKLALHDKSQLHRNLFVNNVTYLSKSCYFCY